MAIGHFARKHAVEERNRAQERLPPPLQMEDKPVKDMLHKLKLAIPIFAKRVNIYIYCNMKLFTDNTHHSL